MNQNIPSNEHYFRLMRILAVCGILLFLTAVVGTGVFVYKNVAKPIEEATALRRDRSLSSPHTIQFDRLEKVTAAWKRKQAAATSTIPAMRDPF